MFNEAAISQFYTTLGEPKITQLVAIFYQSSPHDKLIGPMYPHDDLAGSEKRLRDFLIFRFGGPQHYLQDRGQPRLRMRHAPFAITPEARNRWVALMTKAMDEVTIPDDAYKPMLEFFEHVATFMINR